MTAQANTETTPLLQAGTGASILVEPAVVRPPPEDEETENPDRPKGLRFAVVYGCILLGDFFVGYDTSCVATLAPVISDEFHAIGDVGWYGISYILALVSTILVFGQLYTTFPIKTIFTASFVTFALGSVLCTVAPSSVLFILGRAITGLGGAGIFSGGTIVVANITPLHNRPIYQGISGGVECISFAFGPLISGAIAHLTSSWRFSFLLIAPGCLVNALAITTFVHALPQPEHAGLATKDRWARLDFLGVLLFVPCATSLILSLQWGGSLYRWDDPRIVALLAVAAVLLALFLVSQYRRGDGAMVPLHLLKERAVSLGALGMFFVAGASYVFGFFLPIYFQAIRGANTLTSGVMYLPSAATAALGTLAAGHATSYLGYYTPVMAFGTVAMSVGAGLMTSFSQHTPPAQWVSYQILYSLGTATVFQQPYTAIQTVLPDKYVSTGIVLLSFVQELGGIVALALAQNIFVSRLLGRLQGLGLGLQPRDLLEQGALDLIESVPEEVRGYVYEAYMQTIREVFVVGMVMACLAVVELGIPWRSVKNKKEVASLSS